MKRTILTLSFILAASIGFTHAQNVFKKYGFKKDPLTYTKNYQETFKNEEVVQIGTVLLNTKTNQVIKLLEEDTTKINYKSEFSSRWSCPDPLAEKYYSISPYAYANNNPVINIDPDGKDWYQAENGSTMWRKSSDKEYTDKDGNVYKNIGTEYLYVNGSSATLFQQKKNEDGEMYLTGTTYDVKDKGVSSEDKEATLAMQNSDWSRDAAKTYWKDPTISNWVKYVLKEVLSQYTNPYLVVGGASAGLAGLSALDEKVQFGKTSNQVYHAFRHTDALNLDRAALSTTITNDFRAASSGIGTGQPLNRIVTVNGVRVQYTAYKMPNGTINIGRIHAVK